MTEYYTNSRRKTLFRIEDGVKLFKYQGNSVWKHIMYINLINYKEFFFPVSEEEATLMILDYDD